MSTELQKNLAQEIVKNVKLKRRKNKRELLVSAGYDLTTAKATPARIIEQKGVRKELENLGFSSDGAKQVVAEILYKKTAKDSDRLHAADMVFDVHGDKAPEKHLNINTSVEELREIIKNDLQKFRTNS